MTVEKINTIAQGGAVFHNIRSGTATQTINNVNTVVPKEIYTDARKEIDAWLGNIFPKQYGTGTVTKLKNCTFTDCASLGGSGGTFESDAQTVTLEDCDFLRCYAGKAGGSGGAVNMYTNDKENVGNLKSKLKN